MRRIRSWIATTGSQQAPTSRYSAIAAARQLVVSGTRDARQPHARDRLHDYRRGGEQPVGEHDLPVDKAPRGKLDRAVRHPAVKGGAEPGANNRVELMM